MSHIADLQKQDHQKIPIIAQMFGKPEVLLFMPQS